MFRLAPANEGQLLLKSICKGFDGTLKPSIGTKVPVFSVLVNYPTVHSQPLLTLGIVYGTEL